MELTCQRCHESLRAADRYCPVCGLPQLIYSAEDFPVKLHGDEGPMGLLTVPGGVAWRPAFKAILLLAIPTGLVCSGLTPAGQSIILGLMWITGAAAWAVALYARSTGSGWISAATGARIGLVTGLVASWLSFGVNGVSLWVSRYMLHQGGELDAVWAAAVEKGFARNQEMVTDMGMAGAQSAQALQMAHYFRGFMLSPEGRAGFALGGLAIFAVLLLVFATMGGAVGARLLTQPKRPSA